jgi:hypothetical protein
MLNLIIIVFFVSKFDILNFICIFSFILEIKKSDEDVIGHDKAMR